MSQFTVQDVRLSYQDHGDSSKLPLIFLHAFPLSSKMWQDQIHYFESDFRVICPDLRGLGKSQAGDGQFTIETLADDLIALMDHLEIPRAIWCGLSMGGYTLLRAIQKYPDRCRALILCNTKSLPDENKGKLGRAGHIQLIQNQGLKPFTEAFLQVLFSTENLKSNCDFVQKTSDIMNGQNPIGVCGCLLAMGMRMDTTDGLKDIKVPTLIIGSELDIPCPPQTAQILHQGITGSQLQIIPKAAHLSNLEDAVKFNEIIARFLKELN